MKVFPQFVLVDYKQEKDYKKLQELIRLPVIEIENTRKIFNSENFEYSKIGTLVKDEEIESLYEQMLSAAKLNGYPEPCTKTHSVAVEIAWGKILHANMGITRNEASKAAIWNALACHYMPNLIAWRWEKTGSPSEKPSERWLTEDRQYRHSLGRLWWRFEILKNPDRNANNPYEVLENLGEDEQGQIMERSAFASLPSIPYTLADLHVKNKNSNSDGFRKVIKLVRLRATIRDLEIMEAKGIAKKFITDCYATIFPNFNK